MTDVCPTCNQPLTKLTKDNVQEIFQMSTCSLTDIAEVTGVSRQTVWKIRNRKIYKSWTDELDEPVKTAD
jgi:DNA invertase Pin-like site-specific DNA recombinase